MSDEKDITASNFCLEVDKLTTQYNFLQKFIPYNELSKEYFINNKGCYAFYLNNEKCIEDFIDEIKLRIKQFNTKYANSSAKNLIYIGQTCDNFQERVCKKHLKVKPTAPLRSLVYFLYGIKIKKKDKQLYEIYKNRLLNWVNENISVKFLSIDKNSDIKLVESSLIHLYQPPLNKDGCDEYSEE